MSDVKLFKLHPTGHAVELPGEAVTVERSLQTLIERDSETVLGVAVLASEYSTGKTQGDLPFLRKNEPRSADTRVQCFRCWAPEVEQLTVQTS